MGCLRIVRWRGLKDVNCWCARGEDAVNAISAVLEQNSARHRLFTRNCSPDRTILDVSDIDSRSEPFSARLAPDGSPCPQCAAPMDGTQRYCLGCGARRGAARLDPLEAARLPLSAQAPVVAAAGDNLVESSGGLAAPLIGAAAATGALAGSPSPANWQGLPLAGVDFGGPKTVGAAVLGVLVIGVVLGVVAGPTAPTTSASGAAPASLQAKAPAAPGPLADGPLGDDTASSSGDGSATTDLGTTTTTASDFGTTPDSGGGGGGGGTDTPTTTVTSAAPLKHVWVVTLSGPGSDELYGQAAAARSPGAARAAKADYLGGELRQKGTLLSGFKTVSAAGLANSIALISGQPSNKATELNCPQFAELKPGKINSKSGLVAGTGCLYPAQTKTLPDQMTGAALVWKGYFESIGNDVASGVTSCRRPPKGSDDPFAKPRPGDAYMTWRNPFVYFPSITDSPDCGTGVVGLDRLAPDLETLEDTPAFSLIAPDACHDGNAAGCPDGTGGLEAADTWLKLIIPSILASDAYADGGMIVITSDQVASASAQAEAKAGALVLSPYVAAGATVNSSYNYYSLLKTIEIAFGLDPLGKAADKKVKAFNADVFANAPAAGGD